jgi:RimJ/RimL family protein N-acetyltransferase
VISAPVLPDPVRPNAPRILRLLDRCVRHPGVRLSLQALSLDAVEPLWQATRNPAFNAFLTWPQPAHRGELVARVARMVERSQALEVAYLSGIERATGRWVGLYRIEPDPDWNAQGVFELGMWVHPEFWGAGWAAELHALGTSLGFVESDAPALAARSARANEKGWRTLERMGFRRDLEYFEAAEGGPPIPAYRYRLERGDWERSVAPAAAA